MFRWYIETSEEIDTSDDRWRLLTLHRKGSNGDHSLVAACTIFRFKRWVAKSAANPGETTGPRLMLRICQLAVLPPYRGCGYGTRLLQVIYDYARAEGADVVTVEDPNPSFRLLRDATDYQSCVAAALLRPESTTSVPTPAQLAAARSALRITDEQMQRCYELQQYRLLKQKLAVVGGLQQGNEPARLDEDAIKPFRLLLKKRLNKKHKEELDALLSVQGKQEAEESGDQIGYSGDAALSRDALIASRKEHLERLYRDLIHDYDNVLARVSVSPSDESGTIA
jgi:GNAT superfamily N-acetyltransferase